MRDRIKNAYYAYRRREELAGRKFLSLVDFTELRTKGPFCKDGRFKSLWVMGLGRRKGWKYINISKKEVIAKIKKAMK